MVCMRQRRLWISKSRPTIMIIKCVEYLLVVRLKSVLQCGPLMDCYRAVVIPFRCFLTSFSAVQQIVGRFVL